MSAPVPRLPVGGDAERQSDHDRRPREESARAARPRGGVEAPCHGHEEPDARQVREAIGHPLTSRLQEADHGEEPHHEPREAGGRQIRLDVVPVGAVKNSTTAGARTSGFTLCVCPASSR